MTEVSRRDFLKAAAAAVTTAAVSSNTANAAEGDATTVDLRKDALIVEKKPTKVDGSHLVVFETVKAPEGKRIELNVLASQVYQIATLGDKDGKLKGFVLPQQNGKMKIVQLQPGQEVKLQVFATKDGLDPVLATGASLGAHYKEGAAPNWMKPFIEAVEKDNAIKGAKNNLAAPYYADLPAQFEESVKAKLVPADLKDTAVFQDGAVLEALKAQVAK